MYPGRLDSLTAFSCRFFQSELFNAGLLSRMLIVLSSSLVMHSERWHTHTQFSCAPSSQFILLVQDAHALARGSNWFCARARRGIRFLVSQTPLYLCLLHACAHSKLECAHPPYRPRTTEAHLPTQCSFSTFEVSVCYRNGNSAFTLITNHAIF